MPIYPITSVNLFDFFLTNILAQLSSVKYAILDEMFQPSIHPRFTTLSLLFMKESREHFVVRDRVVNGGCIKGWNISPINVQRVKK